MADIKKATDGPTPFSSISLDYTNLPDWDHDFINEDDVAEFQKALLAPDVSPSEEDLFSPIKRQNTEFITALNDWKPIHQKVRGAPKEKTDRFRRGDRKKRKKPRRGNDETREGWTFTVLKWPLLVIVFGWIIFLSVSYLATRFYIYFYESQVTWRGQRQQLRENLRKQTSYEDWVKAAKELDGYLGNDDWKAESEYSYYDSHTIARVKNQMRSLRREAEADEHSQQRTIAGQRPIDDLRVLVEACVKNNFAGFENTRLYSETYYGTKDLVQSYVNEASASLRFLLSSDQLILEDKRALSKQLGTNFGRTALCLSGGATFAYYHFGIAKALLDADLLPSIITGTSGGALVAALLATRTNEELKSLLVPALAYRITACADPIGVWVRRWWRTGARFDSVEWAKRSSWFCHGSLTFLEAYQRTGRILNVSCVPSDPHSPTILANYLTAPDCVIWSAVLASAAVPGILNPVVLMRKNRSGNLEPYSFGHKWKDGSLRTDIPLKSLNLHFNVNFSIVSQVNPHINLFFFNSRGSVGRPVTHRRGRGWRGGFLGSATEQYLKLDLNKWLKVLRHLELLPRPLGQDWSEIWLQRFSGTITIWPRTRMSDFYYILADPSVERLARMIHIGQLAAWPKLKFVSNRMAIEKVIEDARDATRPPEQPFPTPAIDESRLRGVLSEENRRGSLEKARNNGGNVTVRPASLTSMGGRAPSSTQNPTSQRSDSPRLTKTLSGWWGGLSTAGQTPRTSTDTVRPSMAELPAARSPSIGGLHRRSSVMAELRRQSTVFFDDPEDSHSEPESGDDHDEHSLDHDNELNHTEDEHDGETAEDDDVRPFDHDRRAESGSYSSGLRSFTGDAGAQHDWHRGEEDDEEGEAEDNAAQPFDMDETGLSRGRKGTFVG